MGRRRFKNRIRELRRQKGWTQQDLGNRFNPPRHFTEISRWERGIVMPRGHTLLELARILGVSPEDIYLPGTEPDLSGSKEDAYKSA